MKIENNKISHIYANTLFVEATDKKKIEEVYKDALTIRKKIEKNEDLDVFFKSKVISAKNKKEVLNALKTKLNISFLSFNFINFLIDKRRENIILEIFEAFQNIYFAKNNISKVSIKSPIQLNKNTLKIIKISVVHEGQLIEAFE